MKKTTIATMIATTITTATMIALISIAIATRIAPANRKINKTQNMSNMWTPKWSQQIRNLFPPPSKTTAATKAVNVSISRTSDKDEVSLTSSGASVTPVIKNLQNEEQSEVIKHIMEDLLKEQEFPGPIYKAFTALGHTQAVDFAIINLYEMQELNPHLTPTNWRNLHNLQEYYFYLLDTYEMSTIDDDQWLTIQYQDIIQHQIQCTRERNKNFTSPSHVISPTSQIDNKQNQSQADIPKAKTIRESVKKDPNAYPEFKEDRHYEHWITSVKAHANLHGTLNVLNGNYVPNDLWEQEEFEAQQAFMWSVVVSKVTTANGKMYIRQYPGDAQKIFTLLHEEHRESLKAEYNAEEVKSKIDNMKLDTWNGT